MILVFGAGVVRIIYAWQLSSRYDAAQLVAALRLAFTSTSARSLREIVGDVFSLYLAFIFMEFYGSAIRGAGGIRTHLCRLKLSRILLFLLFSPSS